MTESVGIAEPDMLVFAFVGQVGAARAVLARDGNSHALYRA